MEPRDDGSSAAQRLRSFLVQALGLRELIYIGTALFLVIFFAIPFAHVLHLGPLWPNVFGFAFVLAIARVPINGRAALITIGVAFAAYLTLQFLVLANHTVEPSNDFKTMWETAKDYVEHGLRVPDRPQTQRAIPFYYPMIKLFGTSHYVYLVSNVVMHTLSYAMATWVARRLFGWQAAAKTAIVLLFGFEPMFANTFPSHDVFGAFSVTLFLFLFVEMDGRIEGATSRARLGLVSALAVLISMTITWADWQRGTGVFCTLALVFYAIASFVRRPARWKLRAGLAVAVCAFSMVQSCGLKQAGLAADMEPHNLISPQMNNLVFGSDEGDGRFGDWYRNARMANALDDDEVTRLSHFSLLDSLRENPKRKYTRYLERQETFLRTGIDEAWYVNIESPRWLDEKEFRKLYVGAFKWSRPIWWALALLLGIAAIFRRDVVFDVRMIPMIVVAMFMAAMGMLGEAQSRYSLFFVFVWPIYAGSPYVRNPLPGLRGSLGPPRQIARGVLRVATSVIAVIAAAALLLKLTGYLPSSGLIDLHDTRFMVGKTPGSTAPAGAPPWWKAIRNHIVIADAPIGSHDWTVTMSTTGQAPADDSSLRFVVYNELGKPIDAYAGTPLPDTNEHVPGRALRVTVDGTLRTTIDLSRESVPTAFELPGFAKGEHAITLELDLGGNHRQTLNDKCVHRWTPPDALGRRPTPMCFNTSIGYLGFY